MSTLLIYVSGLVAMSIGIFAFSNIIYPLFFTIPRVRKAKREGGLIKKVPFLLLIWPPILWTGLIVAAIIVINNKIPRYSVAVYVGLAISFFLVIRKFNNPEILKKEFKERYSEYLNF